MARYGFWTEVRRENYYGRPEPEIPMSSVKKKRVARARAEAPPGDLSRRESTPAKPALALAGILLLTFLVYVPSLSNGFTNWDDDAYVTDNPLLPNPDLGAVMRTPVSGNRHPLTILSLILNYRISGYAPASYHWFNLLLHLANTALVFLFVWRLSRGRFWTAAATSLFFGIHPMHVESVAWVSERKDVLYTLFYLLGLIAYLGYLEARRWVWLGVGFVMFVLSLASKPAAVVFPLTLLATDYFVARADRARLVVEKIPFFALSVAAGLLTLSAQTAGGAVNAGWSLFDRVLFASYGSVMYVLKFFLPIGLSAIYPFPVNRAGIGAPYYLSLLVMLVALPALLYVCRRLRPVLFGCAFFFINIVLVLQFFPIGQAVMADRYTYVPYIGLLVALTWWLDETPQPGEGRGSARFLIGVVLALLLPLSVYQSWTRTAVWKDSVTLWTDTIARFPNRIAIAHDNLGLALADRGKIEEAIAQHREAIRLNGNYSKAHNNLGAVLAPLGRLDEAIAEYRKALALDARNADAHNNLGAALATQNKFDEAIRHYGTSLELNPNNSAAYNNLGAALANTGRLDEAVGRFRDAVRIKNNYGAAHVNLGIALASQRRFDEAIAHFRTAIQIDDQNGAAHAQLAETLAQSGRYDPAQLRRVLEANRHNADTDQALSLAMLSLRQPR
jgi:tetratricopeptide (TPR) repeat protein